MTYQETLNFLYAQLPMYSRIGKAAYKIDLKNTLQLCELLGHPETKFRSIHVAGTNGKGSTCHMLAAILQTQGYKTGLYTSPHLIDFRERVRINGEMISKEEVIAFVEKYKEEVIKIGCSFFEWTVGLAFDHFAKHEVDIAVIETGLGGRLDSTNVITPVLSVITNISNDHMDLLGDTLEKIAIEKAGIIKPKVPVVVGRSSGEIKSVFISQALQMNAPIIFAEKKWQLTSSDNESEYWKTTFANEKGEVLQVSADLLGEYQEFNIATVLTACDVLNDLGISVSRDSIISAISQVKKLTGLRGRWDVLQRHPLIIADVAHNEEGLQLVIKQLLQHSPQGNLHFIIGFVKEKDHNKILPLFPTSGKYYFCTPPIPRGLDASVLREKAHHFQLNGEAFDSVKDAYDIALKNADKNDVIYVGGSTFIVAEVFQKLEL